LHNKETPTQADSLKELMNRKTATKCKPEAGEVAATKKRRDTHNIWAEHKGKPSKEEAADCRLQTGQGWLADLLQKIGICESSEFTIRHVPNCTTDKEQLLHCPDLDTDQKVLKTPSNCVGMSERC
jgi:hypothetical protein